jgi:RNA-directed DNA polymerase
MEPEVKKEDGRYCISMGQVELACLKVRSNKGAGGVDGMTWEEFEKHRKELLYKLWNRMTSGSYFAQPTREVEIEKSGGGVRKLGLAGVIGSHSSASSGKHLRTCDRKGISL